jgi:hypothetical protein
MIASLAMVSESGMAFPTSRMALGDDEILYRTLRDSLAGTGARVYCRAICNPESPRADSFARATNFPEVAVTPPRNEKKYSLQTFDFPALKLASPSGNMTGLLAVRAMFREDNDVIVSEARSGLIVIRIGRPPGLILRTRVRRLNLRTLEQYNPFEVPAAIEETRDMRNAMRRLGTSPVLRFASYPLIEPARGLPHLPPSMRDITVDQALDELAGRFGGIVAYGECAMPRRFAIRFVPGAPRGSAERGTKSQSFIFFGRGGNPRVFRTPRERWGLSPPDVLRPYVSAIDPATGWNSLNPR